ncbi:MAG: hypothetical protein QGF09_08350, partial [Rhodospirillales bacterium]|nr:hypothetical protein [Rhodospirillales bacterium]
MNFPALDYAPLHQTLSCQSIGHQSIGQALRLIKRVRNAKLTPFDFDACVATEVKVAETKERSWPLTPGGTIDWETVFEDKETGLIALIEQSRSINALHECAILVIDQLFIRKNDQRLRDKFCAELEDIIGADADAVDLAEASRGVSALLKRIKSERIVKAVEYVARQRTEQPDKERRDPIIFQATSRLNRHSHRRF